MVGRDPGERLERCQSSSLATAVAMKYSRRCKASCRQDCSRSYKGARCHLILILKVPIGFLTKHASAASTHRSNKLLAISTCLEIPPLSSFSETLSSLNAEALVSTPSNSSEDFWGFLHNPLPPCVLCTHRTVSCTYIGHSRDSIRFRQEVDSGGWHSKISKTK